MKLKSLTSLIALAALTNLHSTARAQGSLTPPPGVPAPVMKSLDQVEARTPISSVPFTISSSGSYYLTTNVNIATAGMAITIATNGVALDLNGFTIASTTPGHTAYGIYIGSVKNVLIKNGFIQGGVTNNGSDVYGGVGFDYGIYVSGLNPGNVTVANVSVSGCWSAGIRLSAGTDKQFLADSCTVRTVAGDGIIASSVTRCLAADAGNRGIVCDRATDSHGESISASAFYVGLLANNTAINCTGRAAGGTGLLTICALNCDGVSDSGIGLAAKTANNCSGFRPGGTAISATIASGCYARSGTNIITYKYNMP